MSVEIYLVRDNGTNSSYVEGFQQIETNMANALAGQAFSGAGFDIGDWVGTLTFAEAGKLADWLDDNASNTKTKVDRGGAGAVLIEPGHSQDRYRGHANRIRQLMEASVVHDLLIAYS